MSGARTGCCVKVLPYYTTRCYDTAGNTVWTQNYFQATSTANNILCQTIDASCVYLGGNRTTVSGISYTVMCLDITNGAILWTYDTGTSFTPRQMRVDTSGNLVVWNDNSSGFPNKFVVLATSGGSAGTVVATRSFSTPTMSNGTTTVAVQLTDFVINENGDYHMVGYDSTDTVSHTPFIFEWLSPFTSSPTLYVLDIYNPAASIGPVTSNANSPPSIRRSGGADWIGTVAGVAQCATQAAAPHSASDVVQVINTPNDFPFSGSGVRNSWGQSAGGTTGSIILSAAVASGLTQSSGTVLSAGNVYEFCNPVNTSNRTTSSTDRAVTLPVGSPGDALIIAADYGLTYQPFVFPPNGGTITQYGSTSGINGSWSPRVLNSHESIYAVNTAFFNGDYLVCDESGLNWYATYGLAINAFTGLGHHAIPNSMTQFAVDSSGSVAGSGFGDGQGAQITMMYNASNVLVAGKGQQSAFQAYDSSSNLYTSHSYSSGSHANIAKRDSSGNWQWGHLHLKPSPYSENATLDYDSVGNTIICSGQLKSSTTDVSFVSNPWN